MKNSLVILALAAIVVYFIYFNPTKEGLTNVLQDKKQEEEDTDVHTEDIEDMFNMTEENTNISNVIYLDVEYMNQRGRIIINLNTDVVPKTCKNFNSLCEKKAYNGIKFHRIIKDFMVQGGDITNNDGTGGMSIYGSSFNDENFILKNERGTLSMANGGPNTNSSQFFINTVDTPWLDGKHVVFGKVIKGMDLVDFISNLETDENDKPINDVVIVDSGIM